MQISLFEPIDPILKTFDLTHQDIVMIPFGVVLFILVWLGLNKYLFVPYLQLFAARDQATKGASSSTLEIKKQAETIITEYEQAIIKARVQAMANRNQVILAAKKQASQIVSDAENTAQEQLKQARTQIVLDTEQVLEGLNQKKSDLVTSVVTRLEADERYVSGQGAIN